MTGEQIFRAYENYYNPTLATLFEVAQCPVEASAQGVYVFDENGKKYLDFASGYGVFGVGHLNGRVQAAVQHQLNTLASTPSLLYTQPAADFITKLTGLLPDRLSHVFMAASGSECVEIALTAALLGRPNRKTLIAATNSYHGKTLGALCIMGQHQLRSPFEPLHSDVKFVAYGDVEAISQALTEDSVAVFLEPILGGGYITVPPEGYLAEVRAMCQRTGTLLIIDEVQTGFGRTGQMFGIERDNIVPDILILSKGATGGHVPMAATIIHDSLIRELSHAFAANDFVLGSESVYSPVVCAAASAAIDFIVEENLAKRAAENGEYLLGCLRLVAAGYPELVVDIPGRGLMVGAKLRNSIIENAVWLQMLKRGVISGLSTNSYARHPVIRLFPPLIIDRGEIDVAVQAFHDSLEELSLMPSRLYDLANEFLKFQYFLPKCILRYGARFLANMPSAKPSRVCGRLT